MAWHFEISEWPIILSGLQILMKGNWESSAILAANAVFPLWGGPEDQQAQTIRKTSIRRNILSCTEQSTKSNDRLTDDLIMT